MQTQLLIEMNNGLIYKDYLPLHIMLVEKYNIDINQIKQVGFLVKGNRIIWDKRKPH